jgi:hypothetical protein
MTAAQNPRREIFLDGQVAVNLVEIRATASRQQIFFARTLGGMAKS